MAISEAVVTYVQHLTRRDVLHETQAAKAKKRGHRHVPKLPIEREFSCMMLVVLGVLALMFLRHSLWTVHTLNASADISLASSTSEELTKDGLKSADDLLQGSDWLRQNTASNATVLGLPGYGQAVIILAHRLSAGVDVVPSLASLPVSSLPSFSAR